MPILVDDWFYGNSCDVVLTGFKDSRVTGTAQTDYLNAATTNYTIYEADKTTEFKAETAMPYVADSSGVYKGAIPGTETPTIGGVYWIKVVALEGDVRLEHWEQVQVKRRQT